MQTVESPPTETNHTPTRADKLACIAFIFAFNMALIYLVTSICSHFPTCYMCR